MRSTKPVALTIAAATILLAAGGMAVAKVKIGPDATPVHEHARLAANTAPVDDPRALEALKRPRAAEIPTPILDAYAVLRDAPSESDQLPARYSSIFGAAGGAQDTVYGVNPEIARLASKDAGSSLYFVAGNGFGCLASISEQGYAGGCNSIDEFVTRGGFIGGGGESPGHRRLDGMAPDQIASVRIQRYEGEPVSARVVDNSYSVDYEGFARTVEFLDSSGAAVAQLDLDERG
jgi:hypothetical protein